MMGKNKAVTVKPINKNKRASLSFKDGNVRFTGWRFNLQEREGSIEDHKEECVLAVLEYLASKVRNVVKNKALLPAKPEMPELITPKLEFEAERMACLAINFAAQKA